jgi:hypothetical protein
MTIGILRTDEIKDFLISRLKDGWVIIDGDNDIIPYIEHEYYKPGTPKNALFEVISGSTYIPYKLYSSKLFFIHIGKKDCLPGDFQKDDTRYIYFGDLENKLVCYQLCSRDTGIPIICEGVLKSLGVIAE